MYERCLSKDQWILEAGCGLGPKVLYFREQGVKVIGVNFVYSALKRLKDYSPSTPIACCDVHDLFMKLHKRREMRAILERTGFQVLVEEPVSHSFSLFMLCECFQKDHLGQTNWAAEVVRGWLKKIAPWGTANHLLFVGRE